LRLRLELRLRRRSRRARRRLLRLRRTLCARRRRGRLRRIGLFWPAALMFCLIWLATAFTTRYSSLSALIAAFVTPLFLWWFGHPALASLFVVLTLLLFWKHTENIKRLQSGTEGRIGA